MKKLSMYIYISRLLMPSKTFQESVQQGRRHNNIATNKK